MDQLEERGRKLGCEDVTIGLALQSFEGLSALTLLAVL